MTNPKMYDHQLIQNRKKHWRIGGRYWSTKRNIYVALDNQSHKELGLIFIPRQEDIQGWLMEEGDWSEEYWLLKAFYGWAKRTLIKSEIHQSISELWLRFYMSTHGLTWTGKEWEGK